MRRPGSASVPPLFPLLFGSFLVAALAAALVTVPPAAAVTWNVPSQAPTIQAGVDSAAVGDTVLVACGTYNEKDIVLTSGIILRSATGQADCVTVDMSGMGSGRIFYAEELEPAPTIEGFTLTGGNGGWGGGAIYVFLTNRVVIRNCVIDGNEATDGGGECSPTIVGSS
jgi:hypothetical protein